MKTERDINSQAAALSNAIRTHDIPADAVFELTPEQRAIVGPLARTQKGTYLLLGQFMFGDCGVRRFSGEAVLIIMRAWKKALLVESAQRTAPKEPAA